MITQHIRRLPVLKSERLVGIISLSDLLEFKHPDPTHRLILSDVMHEFGRVVVSALMRSQPVCVFDSDTVGRAAELMLEHKIGGLPVIDADQRLLGVITESDLFRLIAERWRQDNVIFSGVPAHG